MRRVTRGPAELIPLKHSTYPVLLALGDGEAMHGYAIMQAVSAMSDGHEAILPGTLYAALARMVDEGLVSESTPKHDASGGPARRGAITSAPVSAARSRARNPNGCGRSSRWPGRRRCSEARSDPSVSACAARLSRPPP